MSAWPFLLFPTLGALIGWCTNWLAVKMIFRPRRRRRVLGFPVQGLLPRRRSELATSVADTVERDLISVEDLQEVVRQLVGSEKIRALLHGRIDELIDEQLEKLGPMVGAFVSGDLVRTIKARIEEEVLGFVGALSAELHDDLARHIDIHDMVRQRIESFDLARLEGIVNRIAARELRHIELLGGLLGLVVGIAEALIYALVES